MRPRSRRQARKDRDLAAQKPALLLRSRGGCEARFSGYCTGVGSTIHHVLKRSQGGGHDPALLMWVCAPCNGAVEDQPAAARGLGLSIESWEPTAFHRWARDKCVSREAAEEVFAELLAQARRSRCSFESMFATLRSAFEAAESGEPFGVVDGHVWEVL